MGQGVPIQAKSIWFNGRIVPWEQATVHVMTHALHFGSSVFESIRAYDTEHGPALFRLWEHIGRLQESSRTQRLPLPFDGEAIGEAVKALIRDNALASAYVRVLAYRGVGDLTISGRRGPVELMIAAFEWGSYLGQEGVERGIDACVSSWGRSGAIPAAVKSGGNYVSAQLIASEAEQNGFAEGIALDHQGDISCGSGENIFLVIKGELYTPALSSSILPGITRDTIIRLAKRNGFKVHERPLPRSQLYVADEIFLTGTAAEVTPVRSIDRLAVGNGQPGPVTQVLQRAFFSLVRGETDDVDGWLESIAPQSLRGGSSGAW